IVLVLDLGSSTATLTSAGSESYSGGGTSVYTSTSNGNGNGQFNFGSFTNGGNYTYTSTSSYNFGSSDSFSSSVTATASYSDYQAGVYASGSYSLSSVVLQDSGNDSYSFKDGTTLTYSSGQTNTNISVESAGNLLGVPNSGTSDSGNVTTSYFQGESATDTIIANLSASGTDSFTSYQA